MCFSRINTDECTQGTQAGVSFGGSHFARTVLIYASILLQIGLLRAAPVGDSHARQTAASYIARNYAPSSIAKAARRLAAPAAFTAGACRPLKGADGPLGFVVELEPSGFVVVRADDELPPIKLHSATGSYGALPAGFRAVIEAELEGEVAELAGMRSARRAPEPRYRQAWQALAQTAAPAAMETLSLAPAVEMASASVPLLTTAWDQNAPYNSSTPAVSGGSAGHALAGCGPVAMAQIVRYFEAPAAPALDFSYTDSYGSCVGTHRISDVGGLDDYEWSDMPSTLTAASTPVQKQAVGRLLYHCGVAMEANYEATSTSVISQLATARAFREVFGYTCEEYQMRAASTTPAWFAKIQNDLDESHPVYYTMVSALGGHALVCDGYRNSNEIHLNFGISGYGDAWYNMDSVYFHNYTWSQHAAVFGITPYAPSGTNLLTVVNGAGGGEYAFGTPVEVSADPPREGYLFDRWTMTPKDAELGSDFVPTQSVTVLVMPKHKVTLTAVNRAQNVLPVITKCVPVMNHAAVSEGMSVALGVTANDTADADVERGMSNITWYVDGVLTMMTRTGAPNTITSAFTLKTDAATVQGAVFRDVQVKAVALDRRGGATETNWTVRVNNVAASQTIAFKALPVLALEATNFNPGATASSGLQVVYVSSNENVAQIEDGLIHVVGTGTAVITGRQPGSADFKAAQPVRQTLTVKARLTAEMPAGGGTVTGASLYAPGSRVTLTAKPAANTTFLRWEDGTQAATRSLVMPDSNVTVQAWFGPTAQVSRPAVDDPGPQRAMAGVYFSLPLDIHSDSLPTVTVTGLPTGLSYSAATKTITGVPSAVVSNKIGTVTAKNVNKTPCVLSIRITVDPLPLWAQGTFAGTCALRGGTEPGMAQMTVTAQGKVSGKLGAAGTNYTFSATSYTNGQPLRFTAVAVAGKVKMPLTVIVTHPETVPEAAAGLGRVEGWLDGSAETQADVVLYRNVWKDAGMAAVATNYTGYYTSSLPGTEDYGSGYLAFTVDKVGGVKIAGKLADGTVVSQSGSLLLNEDQRVFAVLHTTPAAYKGGCLFGAVQFDKASDSSPVFVRPFEGPAFLWESRNPLATGDYAAGGFSRSLGLVGGWYDTVGNLCRYYAGRELSIDTDNGAPAPELIAGTNRTVSAWWRPDGLALTVTTNKLGVMTGLAAPKAGVPVDPDQDGTWDYGATNTVGLTMALTRATGIFKGAFKSWFDSGSTHTFKSIAYEGVLTPEGEDASDDDIAGRGFFLWADKATYLTPQNKPVTYPFSGSYDVLILAD